MRVLTIGNMYPPHHLGGYELTWLDTNRYLRGRGHEVRTLASDYKRPGAPPDDPAEDAHRELRWYWHDHAWPRHSLRDRVRLERHNAAVLRRHLSEFGPDAVAWWAMGGMSLSLIEQVRRQGVPAAGFVCDGWMGYGPKVDAWIRGTDRPLIRPLAERLLGIPASVDLSDAAHWVFLSEWLRRETARFWKLKSTSVAHKGVSSTDFAPGERRSWRYRLLYAGRIDPRKGIDLAISALAHLPDQAHLVIDGDGDHTHLRELRELADREGLAGRVEFVSSGETRQLRKRYADADAVLFPVRWDEPWGLVPLEAMAVGTPVIASGRGGSGEYLRDRENCLIFEPAGGPHALAGAVAELAEDPGLRGRLREGGFRTARGIDRDGFSAAGERILRELVGEGR